MAHHEVAQGTVFPVVHCLTEGGEELERAPPQTVEDGAGQPRLRLVALRFLQEACDPGSGGDNRDTRMLCVRGGAMRRLQEDDGEGKNEYIDRPG